MPTYISNTIETGPNVRARLVVEEYQLYNNVSYVNTYLQMWRTNSGYSTYSNKGNVYIGIDGMGWKSYGINSSQKITNSTPILVGGVRSESITHDATGRWRANFYVYISGTGVSNMDFNNTAVPITLTPYPIYDLSHNTGYFGLSIQRVSGSVGAQGGISAGTDCLYYGDNVTITATPYTGYSIKSIKVNGTSISSGSTITIVDNADIQVTTDPLASTVSATNAKITETSTISIGRYNTAYYNSLSCDIGGSTKYINSSGELSDNIVYLQTDSIDFILPESLYETIPNSQTGTLTITCKTYNSSKTQVGNNSTCNITYSVDSEICKPIIEAEHTGDEPHDINSLTSSFTGNNHVFINGMSDVKLTVIGEARKSADISQLIINDISIDRSKWTIVDGKKKATTTITGISNIDSSKFKAVDTRGLSAETTIVFDGSTGYYKVGYSPITASVNVYRPNATGTAISADISGLFFFGNFRPDKSNEDTDKNNYNNKVMVSYRYRDKTEQGVWSDSYIIIDPITPTNNNYSPDEDSEVGFYNFNNITLSNGSSPVTPVEFNYKHIYEFEFYISDGRDNNGTFIPLTTITKSIEISSGDTIFDFGENDFNFNVPIKYKGEKIYYINEYGNNTSNPSSVYERYNINQTTQGWRMSSTAVWDWNVDNNNMFNLYTQVLVPKFASSNIDQVQYYALVPLPDRFNTNDFYMLNCNATINFEISDIHNANVYSMSVKANVHNDFEIDAEDYSHIPHQNLYIIVSNPFARLLNLNSTVFNTSFVDVAQMNYISSSNTIPEFMQVSIHIYGTFSEDGM